MKPRPPCAKAEPEQASSSAAATMVDVTRRVLCDLLASDCGQKPMPMFRRKVVMVVGPP